MATHFRFPAKAIFPRPETDNLLAAWKAYDEALQAHPVIGPSTQERRDVAANALYDLMYLASTGDTLADRPAVAVQVAA